jgi:anti-sigma-K factor RskA
MIVHEEFADDLALLALGSLPGEERAAVEKHLEGCAACRLDLQQLRGEMALLALSTAGPKPPARAKERLMRAIAKEPRAQRSESRRAPWWAVLGWATAAAMIIMFTLLWQQNRTLEQHVAGLSAELMQQQAELAKAREIVALLTKPDAVITVVKANTLPQPQGKAFYVRDQARLVFIANNLPQLSPQKAYELWLIPASGAAPIPAGVFKPDAHGSATVINPPLPVGVQPKAFAMTIEPEQGSSTPTMPIVMVGGA